MRINLRTFAVSIQNKKMKRIILTIVLLLGILMEAGAVLKEKDLEQTLSILQKELEQYNQELTVRSAARG